MPFIRTSPEAIKRFGKLVESSRVWLSDKGTLLFIGSSLIITILVADNTTTATELERDFEFTYIEDNMTLIDSPPAEGNFYYYDSDNQPRVRNRCIWVEPEGSDNKSIPEITIYITSSSNSSSQLGDRWRFGFRFEKYNGNTRDFYHYFEFIDEVSDNGIWYQKWQSENTENNDDLEWLRHQQTAEVNSRAYWDKMHLIRNYPSGSSVVVHAIDFELNYWCQDKDGNLYNDSIDEKILISNVGVSGKPRIVIDETLDPVGSIYVTPYIEESLYFEHYIVEEIPEVIKLMVKDVGKYGSDTQDNYSESSLPYRNAKYDEREEESQCSETISWYYYNYLQKGAYGKGLQISEDTPGEWKNIDLAWDMMDIFEDLGQLYRFVDDSGTYKWCKSTDWRDNNYSSDDCNYKPKQADYISWIKPGYWWDKKEHSMILKNDWVVNSNKIDYLDGPWPVKSVDDKTIKDDGDIRWYAGKVREKLSIYDRFWDSDNLFRADRIYFGDINLQLEGTLTAMATVIKLEDGFYARPGSEVTLTHEKGIIGYHKDEEYDCVEVYCEPDGLPCCDDETCIGGLCTAP